MRLDIKTNKQTVQQNKANIIEHLRGKVQMINISEKEANLLEEKKGIPSVRSELKNPDLLVGIDHYFDFVQSEMVTPTAIGFNLAPTSVGYILGAEENGSQVKVKGQPVQPVELPIHSYIIVGKNDDIEMPWKLDSIGIHDCSQENDAKKAIELFQKTIRRDEDGRYTAGWSWKTVCSQLKNH